MDNIAAIDQKLDDARIVKIQMNRLIKCGYKKLLPPY